MRQLREIPFRMLARIVGLRVRVVLVFGEKSDAVWGFMVYFCVVLRFSDPPYAPLDDIFWNWNWGGL